MTETVEGFGSWDSETHEVEDFVEILQMRGSEGTFWYQRSAAESSKGDRRKEGSAGLCGGSGKK